jgi:hypothetical protein
MPGCWVGNAIRYRRVKSELYIPMHSNFEVTDRVTIFPRPKFDIGIESASQVFGFEKLADLSVPGTGCFYLHARWPGGSKYHGPTQFDQPVEDFPPGYDYYVISFHYEYIDWDWLKRQTVGPIIVLTDFNYYQPDYLPNCHFLTWRVWHAVIDQIQQWHGNRFQKNIKYKASAFCNRVTQSKMIATTALAEYMGRDHALLSLSSWAEEKNLHNRTPTNNPVLDNLAEIFYTKYLGQSWSVDDFDHSLNNQGHTSNPAHPAYQQAAIHFTNETHHYSLMVEDGREIILPGPYLTEKTFKCLLGGTAFVPVGQFDTYATLTRLGLQFDYGLDLSFDQDPGNLTRLEKMVDLIKQLSAMSAQDIYQTTLDSTQHNRDCIVSGDFGRACNREIEQTLNRLHEILS